MQVGKEDVSVVRSLQGWIKGGFQSHPCKRRSSEAVAFIFILPFPAQREGNLKMDSWRPPKQAGPDSALIPIPL